MWFFFLSFLLLVNQWPFANYHSLGATWTSLDYDANPSASTLPYCVICKVCTFHLLSMTHLSFFFFLNNFSQLFREVSSIRMPTIKMWLLLHLLYCWLSRDNSNHLLISVYLSLSLLLQIHYSIFWVFFAPSNNNIINSNNNNNLSKHKIFNNASLLHEPALFNLVEYLHINMTVSLL